MADLVATHGLHSPAKFMQLSAARGAILEELVLHLLTMVGYRTVIAGEEGTKAGHSGLEVKGRGTWHQIDALAAFDRTPAFMYPLRLMVEAKCYSGGNKITIETVRNAVGVLKDISENYFAFRSGTGSGTEIQVPRFNYHSAIFSTSGYSTGAQRYAVAHQVFLIQYSRIPLLRPVVQGLLALTARHLASQSAGILSGAITAHLRDEVRGMLTEAPLASPATRALTREGYQYVRENIVRPLLDIHGSYFGMLQGKWPMHLLSRKSLPPEAFAGRDEVLCRIYGRESDRWAFVPVDTREGDSNWFRLEFDIPEEIAEIVEAARNDAIALANIKKEQLSTLELAGKIDGIFRQIRLRIDEDWLKSYLNRFRNKKAVAR